MNRYPEHIHVIPLLKIAEISLEGVKIKIMCINKNPQIAR
jgi:hypothetical protein